MREFRAEEGLKLLEEKREKFEIFRDLLLRYNEKYNLTAVTEEKDVLYKHFLDSVMGESLFPQGARVVEIGSGAGFPSIPLMLVRGDLHFTLIESTGKKCEFLRAAKTELSLNADVLNVRAEDAAKTELREGFDCAVARAVARMNTLTEYCLPFVKTGGVFIAYKGEAEEEIREAKKAVSVLGGKIESVNGFELPENYGKRTLVVIRKEKSTPAKYPRGNGKERKAPL